MHKLSESLASCVGGTQQTRRPSLPPPHIRPSAAAPHLDVDEQLPQVPGWHHHGGVELGDVAFVQSDVVISGESLEQVICFKRLKHVMQV